MGDKTHIEATTYSLSMWNCTVFSMVTKAKKISPLIKLSITQLKILVQNHLSFILKGKVYSKMNVIHTKYSLRPKMSVVFWENFVPKQVSIF